MNGLSFRIILVLIISTIAMWAIIFGLNYFTVIDYVRPNFRDEWYWLNSLVLTSKYFPVAVISSLTLSFGLFFDHAAIKRAIQSTGNFISIINPSVILAIVVTLAYSIVVGYVENGARARLHTIEANSRLATDNYNQAQARLTEFNKSKNPKLIIESLHRISEALILVPEDVAFKALEVELKNLAPKNSMSTKYQEAIKDYTQGKDVFDLISESRRLLKEDPYAALYYAELAFNSELGSVKNEAKILIEEIRAAILKINIKVGENFDITFKRGKQKAILEDYPAGRYIEAYYALKKLKMDYENQKKSKDPDIELWLPIITDKVIEQGFFVQEISVASKYTSANSILVKFLTKKKEEFILYAHRVLRGEFNEYLNDIEILVYNEKHELISDIIAPYGKIIPIVSKDPKTGLQTETGFRLLTRAFDQEQNSMPFEAKLLHGESEIRNIFDLEISGSELWRLAEAGNNYGAMSIGDLIELQNILPKISWDLRPSQLELLDRLFRATVILGLWLLTSSIAWANRNRSNRKPLFLTFVTILILPAVSYFLYLSGLWIGHEIIAQVLTSFGFILSLGLTIILPTLGLIFGIIALGNRKLD